MGITSEVLYQLGYSGNGPILGRLGVPHGKSESSSNYLVEGV